MAHPARSLLAVRSGKRLGRNAQQIGVLRAYTPIGKVEKSMSYQSVIAMLGLSSLVLFPTLGLAQQGTPAPGNSGPMGRRMMGGNMMMGQMTTQHQEMTQLMSKMMQSMTAINAEKDPAKLKTLLAEHTALLNQMHSKMMGQGNMMHEMAGQMKNCPAMGDASK